MPLQWIALLFLLPLEATNLLQEPDYSIVRNADRWVLRKPAAGARPPLTISEHRHRWAAELRRRSLPRLRLPGLIVRFDPATHERTVIADWTAEKDAQEVEEDVREILDRFGSPDMGTLLESTPVYMARLFGATGHTAEENTDFTRFVIYVDPFRATGRLHLAATLIHELTHLERYRARGFHANRAAAVLPKDDFVLLGLADEFAAYNAEANLVRSFIEAHANEKLRSAAREAMRNPSLGWPVALTVMLGFEGPREPAGRTAEARRQVRLDLETKAVRHWKSHRWNSIDSRLRQTIQKWYESSREWKEIAGERPQWKKAGGLIRQAND